MTFFTLKLLLKYTQATFLILFPVFFFFSCRVVKRNKELKRFKNLRLLFQTNFTAQHRNNLCHLVLFSTLLLKHSLQ